MIKLLTYLALLFHSSESYIQIRRDLRVSIKNSPIVRKHITGRVLNNKSNLKESDGEVEPEEFTQKQLIKEEIEAPFRKVRFFIYGAIFAAAGLGSIVSLTKVAATSLNSQGADLSELYTNLGINLGVMPIIGLLWKRDVESQKKLLARIQKGGKLSSLRLKLNIDGESTIVKLSDLRRDRGIEKRVIIVAAPKDLLKNSMLSTINEANSLEANDLVIVPLMIDQSNSESNYVLTATSLEAIVPDVPDIAQYKHIGLPLVLANWNSVIKNEISDALKQQPDALKKGITIIIKKNGKVGSRRFGVPIWESIINDVESRTSIGLDIKNI